MNSKENFVRMFRYDHWANRECLTALGDAGAENPKVLRLVAHTLAAEQLWLERIVQKPQSMAVWPATTLAECAAMADAIANAWFDFLSPLASVDFDRKVEYRNSKGEPWSSRVEDILIHVLMHSAYHRGQAALEMRAAGLVPAYTDFVHAVRQGFLGEGA